MEFPARGIEKIERGNSRGQWNCKKEVEFPGGWSRKNSCTVCGMMWQRVLVFGLANSSHHRCNWSSPPTPPVWIFSGIVISYTYMHQTFFWGGAGETCHMKIFLQKSPTERLGNQCFSDTIVKCLTDILANILIFNQ